MPWFVMRRWAAGQSGSRRVLALVALLLLIYIWQVASAWSDERTLAAREEQQSGSIAFFNQRSAKVISLRGVGIAGGARGSLRFNSRGAMGLLIVQDLPVLPATRLYRLWGVDAAGNLDMGTSFRVLINSESDTVVGVMTPRLLHTYTRFQITVEPVLENPTPSGAIVMINDGP